jgi:hypothetical protein
MPKFNPRRMITNAVRIMKIGTNLRIRVRRDIGMNLPNIIKDIINGNVPKPNINIKALPAQRLPVAIAEPMAK